MLALPLLVCSMRPPVLLPPNHGALIITWYHSSLGSKTSSAPTAWHRQSTTRRRAQRHSQPSSDRRTYASAAHGNDGDVSPLRWPKPDHPGAIPTPYQIFNHRKDAPYSKDRFYELVKAYHPDRSGCPDECAEVTQLPRAVRLERFRLVIMANSILSDPVKRKAYDSCGTGWAYVAADKGPRRQDWNHQHWAYYYSADSPRSNATWEDWQRWYQRQEGEKQAPVFVENGAFVSAVITIAVLGGVVETIRAQGFSTALNQHQDRLHDATYKELERRRKEMEPPEPAKPGRIGHFRRLRAPSGYSTTDPMEGQQRRALPAPETSSSLHVKGRPTGAGRE